ncbi:MAG: hypothetical protein N3F09_07470 [Bacteroidia bacterium]|nr:hypothetical protein [Bacteroidia bacterium]
MNIVKIIIIYSFFTALFAQPLPDTDIHFYERNFKTHTWTKIKSHDSAKYENQIYFIDSKKYLFVKQHQTHTAVFMYDIKRKKEKLIIQDTMNIFSPIPIDKYACQAIVQDRLERQFMVRYMKNCKTKILSIILNADMPGYHAYLNKDTLIYYHVGKNEHQIRVKINDTTEHTIGKNPLACLYVSGKHEFIWAHRADSACFIFEYRIKSMKNTLILRSIPINHFFYNSKNEILVLIQNEIKFYRKDGTISQSIPLPEDLKDKNIKRFYQSPDGKYFAFVTQKN